MSLGCVCRLVLRVLPKIFPVSPSLLTKTFQSEEHLNRAANVANGFPELPQEILLDIFSQLEVPDLVRAGSEVPDLVRAGSVCSSWHAAYTSLCRTGPCRLHQTPCLLYTSASSGASAVGLYSLAEKKAYTLTLPDPPIRSRHIIGSSYGWIITVDDMCDVHLVNPITCEQIVLPSVTTIEQVTPIFDDAGSPRKYEYSWYTGNEIIADSPSICSPSELRDYLFYKAFLSSDPSTGDYFVVLIHNPQSQLSFARAGADKWTWLPPHKNYEDCLFQGDYLYASTSYGAIHAFDLGAATAKPKIVLGNMKGYLLERIYIMTAPCGEWLQIWRSDDWDEVESDSDSELELDDESQMSKTSKVKVHKVDLTSGHLVELSGLNEHVLFFGLNQSHCLLAKDYPLLKANHAYFTDDDSLGITWYNKEKHDIGVFNIENNCREEIVSPQLWSNSPTPVWLIPNPRRMS
ncbi:hypothetical protein QOZ80_9AG0684700 [Eleusine coracana subsp. coracana]|nr:hypothetical protein QOZ80_9AG0684700 [Eleusine coracana subsp. coracana]